MSVNTGLEVEMKKRYEELKAFTFISFTTADKTEKTIASTIQIGSIRLNYRNV